MNRDPLNKEITRDPIFLLQTGKRLWTAIPDGIEYDGESMSVTDMSLIPEWIEPFLDAEGFVNTTEDFYRVAEDCHNEHGWPLIYVEWKTESVFLTRQEAEEYGKARKYRWDKWRVYCIPCDGELARILNTI